ncbi:MAG TPA: hypothetical protein VL462_00125 [Candidatus Nitrosotalea sp.]|jgi:ABC-type sulfate transport system permease component|nr:hypothetical protein [Candidatus Nitrosotalea sp.]
MSMSSEQQPWWLPNPSQRFAQGLPGLGWFGGCLMVGLVGWPPAMIAVLIAGPGRHGNWTVEIDPLTHAALSGNFLATLVIACLAGLASWRCAWFLWRGSGRRDLWRAIFCIWLILPGQAAGLSLLHWFLLWQQNIGIYDVWLRLHGIGNASLLAAIVSAYLLLSRRMRYRFSPVADLAAVF